MTRRLRREVGVGLAVVLAAAVAAFWQAERTAAFDSPSDSGRALRLVCPLH